MCGRYTLSVPAEQVAKQFDLAEVPDLAPRYNIAPTQPVPVVRAGPGGHELALLRWGLIPSWAKDSTIGARMINARSETAAEKPAFRVAMQRRRCLIPADGFYEWQQAKGGKQPFYIRLADGEPFALAGLWESWRDPDGDLIQTCTILTTEANELVRPLHDRMPVILSPAEYERWLDPELHEAGLLQPMLDPFPAEKMETYPVGKAVNRVGNDGPELVAPLG